MSLLLQKKKTQLTTNDRLETEKGQRETWGPRCWCPSLTALLIPHTSQLLSSPRAPTWGPWGAALRVYWRSLRTVILCVPLQQTA